MRQVSASQIQKGLAAAGVALLTACASVGSGVSWNILPAGSSWQVEQRNTGSYGKDVTFQITRGESLWQGQKVVTLTNSASGAKVMSLPDGRWVAIVSRDDRPLVTYDPPIGYLFPLSVGQSWNTRHKMTGPSGATTEFSYNCKVEARERVTVPAGSFDTLRIVCESPVSRDVSWMIVDMGMHARQEFQRFAGHPQGAGTQSARLMAVNRAS